MHTASQAPALRAPLADSPAGVDALTFRKALGCFATGVAVVTARDDDAADVGITVSALASLSLEPPLLLICIDRRASMHGKLQSTRHFAVSVLAANQERLARQFAGPHRERFTDVALERGMTGAALIAGAHAHVECELVETHAGGDHTIFIGRVIATRIESVAPLLHHEGTYRQLPR